MQVSGTGQVINFFHRLSFRLSNIVRLLKLIIAKFSTLIPDSTIVEIKNRIDIEEVVGDFVSLKRKGQNLWACCPFHNEKTPSFSVSPAKGFYKCFGCGKGGDAIDFVMEAEKLNYLEALRYLAKKYGIEIKEEALSEDELKDQSERESLYIVLNFAKTYFVNNLTGSSAGKNIGQSYFSERDIADEIREKFELGYTLDKWDGLLIAAKEAGHSVEMLEQAGLIIAKDDRYYDRFRGRIIFPVHNVTGRVVAFGARALKKDDKPKYINSPETPVYHKSNVLYGLFQAKQAIRQQQNCYLVEGYTDVTRMHQIGIENVVASSGTSLTVEQVQLVGRFSKQLTVLYDGDTAGLQASLRGIDIILANGLDVKVVVFPEGHDPDSYARELGANEFKVFLEGKARDFIHFKLKLLAEQAGNDPVKKTAAIKDVVGSIAQIPDQVKRSVYVKEASKVLEMEERVLVGEMNNALLKASKSRSARTAEQVPVAPTTAASQRSAKNETFDINNLIAHQEKESIRLLLKYGFNEMKKGKQLYQYLFSELEDVVFTNPVYAKIFDEFKSMLADDKVVDAQHFIDAGSPDVRKAVIDIVHDRHQVSSHWTDKYKIRIPLEAEGDMLEQVAYTNVLRLKQRVVRKLIEDNLEKLKDAKTEQEQAEVQQIHHELKLTEKEIANHLGNVILK
jgi:DNA primase